MDRSTKANLNVVKDVAREFIPYLESVHMKVNGCMTSEMGKGKWHTKMEMSTMGHGFTIWYFDIFLNFLINLLECNHMIGCFKKNLRKSVFLRSNSLNYAPLFKSRNNLSNTNTLLQLSYRTKLKKNEISTKNEFNSMIL